MRITARVPSPRRLAAAAAVAVTLSFGAVACADGNGNGDAAPPATSEPIQFDFSGTAATVNGQLVPASVISAQLDAFRANPAAIRPAFGVDRVDQAGSDQPSPDIVANVLSTELLSLVIEREVAARGLQVTEQDLALAGTQMRAQFGDSLDGAPDLRDQLVRRFAQYVVLDRALAGPAPTEADLVAAYEADPERWAEVCSRHILLGSEADARAALEEVQGGRPFAEVAADRSTDRGSGARGGDLGCQPRGRFVAGFEEAVWSAPVGTPTGPVESEFGYHVVEVTSREQPTFEQARDRIAAALSPPAFAPLRDWLEQTVPTLQVEVDPRFGTWAPELGQVEPVGLPDRSLPINPAATTTSLR